MSFQGQLSLQIFGLSNDLSRMTHVLFYFGLVNITQQYHTFKLKTITHTFQHFPREITTCTINFIVILSSQ